MQKEKASLWLLLPILLIFITGCGLDGNAVSGKDGQVVQTGIASYYGEEFQGRKTASGELFDMNKLTAAHRSLPFGTTVEVTNLENGRRVQVRINDRGPNDPSKIIDLSKRAAIELGMIKQGTAQVSIRIVR